MSSQLPNPIASPPWVQLIQWIADPIAFQNRYRPIYGDVFSIQLGGLGSFVLVGDPQMIQEIFSQDTKFQVGSANHLAEPLLGKNSLMLMDGDRHRRERKLLMPSFHGERLHTYAQQICQITDQVTRQWQIESPIVARTEMQKISLAVIMQIVFGLSEGERYQQIKPLLTEFLNLTDSPLRSSMLFLRVLQQDWGGWTPWGQMKQRQRHIHQLLQAEIEERRSHSSEARSDMLSLMMAARDEQGHPMTDDELRDELLTMLFAGHETTATILAWALYQIHRHADVQDRLLTELDKAGDLSPIELAQLPYLSAVCQETLRMYPVIPAIFARATTSPITLAGHSLSVNTVILGSIYLVHYREDLYPNPHEFQPDRFLDRQYSPSEYFPFGGGSRRCLGYALAQLEMKLVLAKVLSNYQLNLVSDRPVKVQRRGFTLAPKGGVQMVMTGRR